MRTRRFFWTSQTILFLVALLFPFKIFASSELYPGGFSAVETLEEKSWFLAPQGWLAYGINDNFMLAWDWYLVFGGIPALQARHTFSPDNTQWTLGSEVYGVYFPNDIEDTRTKDYTLVHAQKSSIIYYRFLAGRTLDYGFKFDFYFGYSYSDQEEYKDPTANRFQTKSFGPSVTPDFGLGLRRKVSDQFSWYVNLSSGNTFVLFDQILRKNMAVVGFEHQPWANNQNAFLRNFYYQISTIYVHIPNAKYEMGFPIYPTLYFEWKN